MHAISIIWKVSYPTATRTREGRVNAVGYFDTVA